MIITALTKSGSVYKIDTVLKEWGRIVKTSRSGPVRHDDEFQKYEEMEPIVVGQGIVLRCKPLPESHPTAYVRLVYTSNVVWVSYE